MCRSESCLDPSARAGRGWTTVLGWSGTPQLNILLYSCLCTVAVRPGSLGGYGRSTVRPESFGGYGRSASRLLRPVSRRSATDEPASGQGLSVRDMVLHLRGPSTLGVPLSVSITHRQVPSPLPPSCACLGGVSRSAGADLSSLCTVLGCRVQSPPSYRPPGYVS